MGWLKLNGDAASLAVGGHVVDATDEASGTVVAADDDHRARGGRIVCNAFAEKEFCVRGGVHDEAGGRAFVFDVDGPCIVRLRILLFCNMLIAVFVADWERRLHQFCLKIGLPCSEIVEEQVDVVVGGGFDVEDVEKDTVAEADGTVEEDSLIGGGAFSLGDAEIVVLCEAEQLAGGGGL